MINPTTLWATLRVALGFAVAVTSLVWGIEVYRAGVVGTRVAAITNQLTLAAICQTNNGTVDDVLCGSYLAAFNKNFAAILTTVARADGATTINLLPSDSEHHPLGIAVILAITFVCTTVGVLVMRLLASRLWRHDENREKAKEIHHMEPETFQENKTAGIVGVKALRA